jgi:hypothetical protein
MKNKASCFLLISLILLIPPCVDNNRIITRKLICAFRENKALEDEFIKKNVFTLSSFEKQLVSLAKSGWGHKLILKDSLGDLWIFKQDNNAVKNVSVYRFFKLFGLSSPAAFTVILPVNGRMETGSMQKLIRNVWNLKTLLPEDLPRDALQRILEFHLLDWLISDFDSNGENFLIKKDKINPELFRVDTEAAFLTFGSDVLKPDYSPGFINPEENYYYLVFKAYEENVIRLNFIEPYKLAVLISAFPDSEIMAILEVAIRASFNNERKEIFKTLSAYRKAVNLRKRNLSGDFKKFYTDLAEKKRLKISLPDEPDNSVLERIYRKLEKDNKDLRQKIKLLKTMKAVRQEEIKVVASYRAWELLRDFITDCRNQFIRENKDILSKLSMDESLQMLEDWFNKKISSPAVFKHLIKELEDVKKDATGENARKAVDWYIEQLFEIKNSGRSLTSITRIIEPPVEK